MSKRNELMTGTNLVGVPNAQLSGQGEIGNGIVKPMVPTKLSHYDTRSHNQYNSIEAQQDIGSNQR